MFFEDGSGAMEQLFRFIVSCVSYLVPNWAIIYVFYFLPRFQFSTVLDVPDIIMDDFGADGTYELLLPAQDDPGTSTRQSL